MSPLPQTWTNFLASSENKANSANFLSKQIALKETFDKQIVTSGEFDDEFEVWSFKDTIETSQLISTHEEADNRLILHAINSKQIYIVVSTKDKDV